MSSASVSPASGSPVAEHTTGPIALAGAPRPAGAPKPKPRKRVNTAEKRHQHNAIERQRRETLNSKFLVLARLLPSLAACRRPSKSAIVNGSISHLSHQRNQRLLASKLLRQLAAERDELLSEVNQWRQANGCQPKPARQWTDEIDEICQVEHEKFGSFANVDDNGDDQGDDEDEPSNVELGFDSMNIETANLVAGSFSTGLVTPRSSTDMGMPVNGFNWTGSTFTVAPAPAPAPSLPFNAFMSDSVEGSSMPSPVGSSHNSAILTPKSAVDPATLYTQTPSPGSSSSPEDTSASSPSQQWSPQQLAMFQQQVQHQNLQRQHQAALAAALGGHSQGELGNMIIGGQQLQQPQQAGLAHLMATMFPQHSPEQAEQWRKIALGGLHAPANTRSTSGAFGFGGLHNGWTEQPVGV